MMNELVTQAHYGANSAMMHGGGHHGFAHGGIGILIAVLVIIGILLLARWIFKSTGCCGHHQRKASKQSALSILDERFAKGEINKDEYLERKSTLEGES